MNKLNFFSWSLAALLSAAPIWAATIPSTITVTQSGDTTTYTGVSGGTISGDALNVSGTTIFTHTGAGNIIVNSNITGTGTIRHTAALNDGNTKLTIQGTLSGFSGTISQESHRWIEIFTSDATTTLDGSTAYYDMKNIVLSGTTGKYGSQGFAPGSINSKANKVVWQIGDLVSSTNCDVMSSGVSTVPTVLQVGHLNNDSTFSGKIYHNNIQEQAGLAKNYISVEKVGSGTWTLTGNSTYLGDTTVTAGTLQIGAGGTSGAIESPVINLGKDGTLVMNRSDNVTWTRTFNFETAQSPWSSRIFDPATDAQYITSNIVKKGAGTWKLTFNSGSSEKFYRYYNTQDLGWAYCVKSNIEIAEGVLDIYSNVNNDLLIYGSLSGSGTLYQNQNDKKLILFGNNQDFTGTIRRNSNRWIELYSAVSASPDATYHLTGAQGIAFIAKGDETFTLGALIGDAMLIRSGCSSGKLSLQVGNEKQLVADADNVYSGNMGSDNGGFARIEKIGVGTWTLTGTSYSGGTLAVTGGALQIGNGGTTGSVASTNIEVGANGTFIMNRSDNVAWTGKTLTTKSSYSGTTPWSSRLFDPATDSQYITSSIVKKGAGTWSVTFPESQAKEKLCVKYDGSTDGGVVVINSNLDIQEGTLAFYNAKEHSNIAVLGNITGSGTLLHATNKDNKLALFGDNSGFTGTLKATAPRWIELYGSETSFPNAVCQLVSGSQGFAVVSIGDEDFYFGALTGKGSIFRSDYSTGNPTAVIGNEKQLVAEDENVFSGNFTSNYGKISVRKTGADTWTYAGTSAHAGDTTVDGGLMKLTGTLSKSNVVVEKGGELEFTGVVGSTGTEADLTIRGGLVIDLAEFLNEDGVVFGDVTFGEEAYVAVLMDDLTIEDAWDATYHLKANSFNIPEGMNFGDLLDNAVGLGLSSNIWTYSLDGGLLTISMDHNAVPEPATWVLLLSSVFGLALLRSRKRVAKALVPALFLALLPVLANAQTPENGVCAHRGASIERPENSLAAFQQAIDIGADWIETDVIPTADGVLVLCHNPTTGEYTSQNLEITKTTFAELSKLDMAEKFRARNKLTLEQCPTLRITLLEEALELILKNKKARLTLHMKGNSLPGIVKLVKEMGAEDWIGFNGHESLLVPAKKEFPNAPLFWDRYGTDVDADIALGKKLGFNTMIFAYRDVTPEKAAKVRDAGFVVGAWTVNGEKDMNALLDAGVTRFYTDNPRLLLKVLEERK